MSISIALLYININAEIRTYIHLYAHITTVSTFVHTYIHTYYSYNYFILTTQEEHTVHRKKACFKSGTIDEHRITRPVSFCFVSLYVQYVCMYVCMYLCMYLCIYLCIYICMYDCSKFGYMHYKLHNRCIKCTKSPIVYESNVYICMCIIHS